MVRTAARDTGRALVRVLYYTIISTVSTSVEVTFNPISALLRCHIMILLTLKASHNIVFLRVDINIVKLIIQKNIISYDKFSFS